MRITEHEIYAFLLGAALASLATYLSLTRERRTVARVQDALGELELHHELSSSEHRQFISSELATDHEILSLHSWAKGVCQRAKKDHGIRLSASVLTAEVIICQKFFDLDEIAATCALVQCTEKGKSLKDIGVLLGKKSNGTIKEEEFRARKEGQRREERDLKNRILEDLSAIARQERSSFTPEGRGAANALQERHGNHPDTLAEWAPLLKHLASDTVDPQKIHEQIDDLLYPDTLEDVETLQQIWNEEFRMLTSHEIKRFSPDGIKATQALARLRERQKRKNQEEHEAAIAERRQEEVRRETFREAIAEMNRPIARRYGLPEDTPPDKLLAHIRSLNLVREFEKKPIEERERVLRELENELDDYEKKGTPQTGRANSSFCCAVRSYSF
jgi:hypothetical protein